MKQDRGILIYNVLIWFGAFLLLLILKLIGVNLSWAVVLAPLVLYSICVLTQSILALIVVKTYLFKTSKNRGDIR